VQVSFRLNEAEAEIFERLRDGMTRPGFAKMRALAEISQTTDGLAEAQAVVDAKNEEIAQLKRELAKRPSQEVTRTNLPGLTTKRYICSACSRLNVRGRCIDHPTATQKAL
jgi:hypothetical protein